MARQPHRPMIRRGPASAYQLTGETIVEFTDGQSGGLIAIKRSGGRLLVDLYRLDDDVVVRTEEGHYWAAAPTTTDPKEGD